jgi:hypothetical protein
MSATYLGEKRMHAHILAIADGIARPDVDQVERERVAESVADALQEDEKIRPHVNREIFVLLASDPLVPCDGVAGEGCPHLRVIRVSMHNRHAPDGRSAAWERRAPYGRIRCVSCGAERHRRRDGDDPVVQTITDKLYGETP